MIILVDARSMGSRPSGIGMYIYNFVKELSKHDKLEFVLLSDISTSPEMECFSGGNVKIINYGKPVKKNFGLYGYYKFVQKCIHQEKPGIFWEPNNLMPIRIKNPYGKIMITVHDLFPITSPEYYGRLYENYFKYGLNKTSRMTDIVLYDSLESKKEMEKYYPVIRDKKSFISYIIINKIPVTHISDRGYFLYVGNLEKRKGTDLLLKAYKRYRQKGGKMDLYLGGKMREEAMQQLYDEIRNTTAGLDYIGYLEEDKKNEFYAGCSCFVFPSKAEGFGMPPVEVMNFGKPIIASNLSIFKEILEDNVNYFDLNCNEELQIENLCNVMFDYREAPIAEYKKIIEKFDASSLGDALKNFIEDCK